MLAQEEGGRTRYLDADNVFFEITLVALLLHSGLVHGRRYIIAISNQDSIDVSRVVPHICSRADRLCATGCLVAPPREFKSNMLFCG